MATQKERLRAYFIVTNPECQLSGKILSHALTRFTILLSNFAMATKTKTARR